MDDAWLLGSGRDAVVATEEENHGTNAGQDCDQSDQCKTLEHRYSPLDVGPGYDLINALGD